MKMQRLNIQLPKDLKRKLDAERMRGTSAAGLIRHLLEQHSKGRKPRNSRVTRRISWGHGFSI
jgi:hypothetical protein